jgi:hypothetical protein
MKDKAKRTWLIVLGALVCVALVVAIAGRFSAPPAVTDPVLDSGTPETSEPVVDIDTPENTGKHSLPSRRAGAQTIAVRCMYPASGISVEAGKAWVSWPMISTRTETKSARWINREAYMGRSQMAALFSFQKEVFI